MATGLLPPGTECLYEETGGGHSSVTILQIHTDDVPPYYTVRMPNGSERATVQERLSPVGCKALSKRPSPAGVVISSSSDSSGSCSSSSGGKNSPLYK